MIYYRCCHL